MERFEIDIFANRPFDDTKRLFETDFFFNPMVHILDILPPYKV